MNARHGEDASIGFLKRSLHIRVPGNISLEVQEGRYELKAVADPVIDLAQKERTLLGERLELVPGDSNLRLGSLLVALDGRRKHRIGNSFFQEDQEVAVNVLHDIVRRARL